IAASLGTVLALWITRPIQQLRGAAEAMARGELDRRTGISRGDEIGDLAATFDSMAERLGHTVGALEAAVDEAGANERRFRELFDEAPVAYHEVDAAGRIVRVNRTELTMLGYAADEMLGHPFFDFVADDDLEEARRRHATRL